jgi:hypothetical protein
MEEYCKRKVNSEHAQCFYEPEKKKIDKFIIDRFKGFEAFDQIVSDAMLKMIFPAECREHAIEIHEQEMCWDPRVEQIPMLKKR